MHSFVLFVIVDIENNNNYKPVCKIDFLLYEWLYFIDK